MLIRISGINEHVICVVSESYIISASNKEVNALLESQAMGHTRPPTGF